MPSEANTVDIDDKNFQPVEAPRAQRLELLRARRDEFAADRRTRKPHRLGHLRQYFGVVAGRNSAEQDLQHPCAGAVVGLERLISRHRYFRAHPAAAPAQADPLDLELAIRSPHRRGGRAAARPPPAAPTVPAPPRWSRARSHRSAPPARSGRSPPIPLAATDLARSSSTTAPARVCPVG